MPTFTATDGASARVLDVLAGEFDEQLARMQTPRARKGMAAAFSATPGRLGRAAVAAAKKRAT